MMPVKINVERALETLNRLGLALVIAGWLHGFVGNGPTHRAALMVGLVLVILSLVRKK